MSRTDALEALMADSHLALPGDPHLKRYWAIVNVLIVEILFQKHEDGSGSDSGSGGGSSSGSGSGSVSTQRIKDLAQLRIVMLSNGVF